MRKFILAGFAAAAILPAAAQAQNRPAPARPATPAAQPARPAAQQQSPIPQAAGLIVLIKGSLIALNQANQTGNYTVLHALGSDTLRASSNPQTLAQSFAAFRQRNVDLSPAIYLDPQLTRPAAIEGGRLHLVGAFPTQPMRITFDIWFEPSQGRWKFVQLNAGLAPAQAQPQQAPQRR
jgi:hypothetical protein